MLSSLALTPLKEITRILRYHKNDLLRNNHLSFDYTYINIYIYIYICT